MSVFGFGRTFVQRPTLLTGWLSLIAFRDLRGCRPGTGLRRIGYWRRPAIAGRGMGLCRCCQGLRPSERVRQNLLVEGRGDLR